MPGAQFLVLPPNDFSQVQAAGIREDARKDLTPHGTRDDWPAAAALPTLGQTLLPNVVEFPAREEPVHLAKQGIQQRASAPAPSDHVEYLLATCAFRRHERAVIRFDDEGSSSGCMAATALKRLCLDEPRRTARDGWSLSMCDRGYTTLSRRGAESLDKANEIGSVGRRRRTRCLLAPDVAERHSAQNAVENDSTSMPGATSGSRELPPEGDHPSRHGLTGIRIRDGDGRQSAMRGTLERETV